jgi:hypothetical protein
MYNLFLPWDCTEHEVVERNWHPFTFVTHVPDVAPLIYLDARMGVCGRRAAKSEGVTNQEDFEAWLIVEVKRICKLSIENRNTLGKMSKSKQVDFVKGLAKQCLDAESHTFYSDVLTALRACDVLTQESKSLIRDEYPERTQTTFTLHAKRPNNIVIEDFSFTGREDWAWRWLEKLGVNL